MQVQDLCPMTFSQWPSVPVSVCDLIQAYIDQGPSGDIKDGHFEGPGSEDVCFFQNGEVTWDRLVQWLATGQEVQLSKFQEHNRMANPTVRDGQIDKLSIHLRCQLFSGSWDLHFMRVAMADKGPCFQTQALPGSKQLSITEKWRQLDEHCEAIAPWQPMVFSV